MLLLGLYNVATSNNVKSSLKQNCVFQGWNLQRWTTSNQGFVVDLNIVKQLRNNVFIFSVHFSNFGQRQNNVVNITICKKLKNNLQAI